MKKIIYTLVLSLLGLLGYAQTWSVGTGSLFTNPSTTKVGVGITPSELFHVNGGALKIGNGSDANSRAINMIKIGDGNYIKIGEWEKDDQLSLYASQGFSFTGGRTNFGGSICMTGSTHFIFGYSDGNGVINFGNNNNGGLYFRSLATAGNISPYNDLMLLTYDGKLGIGTTEPKQKLAVNGTIGAKEVLVTLAGWPDYVFGKDYNLMPLSELEQFITENSHLPEIPSAKEVEENGVSLGEMQAKLLQKVEELTLYAIEQQKFIEKLENRLSELESKKGGE